MIPRYTLPEMAAVWTDGNRLSNWLRIEVLACEAWAELGRIPQEDLETIRERASFTVDRVLEIERKKKIIAIKNVTINEPFFVGHFPGFPIMPGVLIVEAMAQAGGALLLTEVEDRAGKLIVFTGIEKARFRRPVVPGDQLRLEVEMLSWKAISSCIAVKIVGKGFVNGKLVCEATLSCQLVERPAGQAAPAAEPGTTE